MTRCLTIARTDPRPGGTEAPQLTRRGHELASPHHGAEKHHAKHAVFVRTLDEAAALIAEGYSLRMGRPGVRSSLISPEKLRISRA